MKIQKSFKNTNSTLYIIPTPIGNLEDITIRALRIMREELDILLCEDTRLTRKLLNKYDIKVNTKAYHEFNKEQVTKEYINDILSGKTYGLVSDAGMPGISDPGFDLIKEASKHQINVVVLPGASAFVVALVRSNLPNTKFEYFGFLSPSLSKKKQQLIDLFDKEITTIIYESPHKLITTLKIMSIIDENRDIVVARELTKINEEYISSNVSDVLLHFQQKAPRGEFVIVISPMKKKSFEENLSIQEHVQKLEDEGLSQKDAIKKAAKSRNLKKNEVYQLFVGEKNEWNNCSNCNAKWSWGNFYNKNFW
ncbi:MAG: 16S rRNA (cytidine(1402)-2'-O)-methyltransferase [Mycoplasmatales bacterium]